MRNHELLALYAQHTVTPPAMTFTRARWILEGFAETTSALLPFEQCFRIDDTVREAALAFLTYRFTPLLVTDCDFDVAFEAAGLVLSFSDSNIHVRFLEEIVLNVVNPDDLRVFAKMVRRIAPDRLEATLLRYARCNNDLHARNAFWLTYHLQHPWSESAWGELVAMGAYLVERHDTNVYLREAATLVL